MAACDQLQQQQFSGLQRRPGGPVKDPYGRPDVNVDWDITPNEWQQLRMTLWHSNTPFAMAMAQDGALGKKPTLREEVRWQSGLDSRYVGY